MDRKFTGQESNQPGQDIESCDHEFEFSRTVFTLCFLSISFRKGRMVSFL